MEKIFNTLLNSFIEEKVGIAEHFLNEALANGLKANLIALFAENKLQAAGTGNNATAGYDAAFRGDHIYWLDRSHNDIHENSFFDLMDRFVKYLNETCYTGISSYEFHYTLYEKGTFYKKHMDRFRDDDSRKFSMIMYLNAAWEEKDGGQLCIHHAGRIQTIAPTSGKIVFFKSNEMEHEVLPANKARMSITGWLRS